MIGKTIEINWVKKLLNVGHPIFSPLFFSVGLSLHRFSKQGGFGKCFMSPTDYRFAKSLIAVDGEKIVLRWQNGQEDLYDYL